MSKTKRPAGGQSDPPPKRSAVLYQFPAPMLRTEQGRENVSVPAGRFSSSAQASGGERESTPAIPPTGEVNPPSGPRAPFTNTRRQYSAQTVLYAATLAILIVWFGVIAAIAAWSNSK